MNSEYERGWQQADDDISTGMAKLGDPGFAPPMNDFQAGYNDRIEARSRPDLVGVLLIVAIGAAILFALMLFLYR